METQNTKTGITNAQIAKIVVGVIAAIVVVILAFNCAYQVKEQEQAVLLTFGKPSTVSDSGLHFKIPFVQEVKKVDTTIKSFTLGYDEISGNVIEDESLMITSDYNFLNVDFFVEYKVSDPILALYATESPELVLKNVAQSSVRTVIGNSLVDSVLTTEKGQIQSDIYDMITHKLDQLNIGIYLVNITMQDSEPPTKEVMEAFKNVETAKQGMETAINNANKYNNEKMPAAEAQVDKILQEAEATKQERINEANATVAEFNAMYEEYIKYPAITKQRMFFETMSELLPSLNVIIDTGDGEITKLLPLSSFADFETTTGTVQP
ncbi:MAG: FtsH protease activity modulator HflK [Lachnospiraceae bacterium]|nr:FtsH protease activity modulator HflK [Lachnospiraceae bacterium]